MILFKNIDFPLELALFRAQLREKDVEPPPPPGGGSCFC